MQIRIPSMMIHRDGLMASPYGSAQNFEKILNARNAPPSAGYSMNPLQEREAMQKMAFEQRRSELLSKASGNSGLSTQWVAKNWLTVSLIELPFAFLHLRECATFTFSSVHRPDTSSSYLNGTNIPRLIMLPLNNVHLPVFSMVQLRVSSWQDHD